MHYSNTISCILLLISSFAFSQTGPPDFSDVTKISKEINSEYEENGPLYDPNSKRLYFIRSFHPENIGGEVAGQDIWYSKNSGGAWGKPVNFSSLNNKVNNAVIGVSTYGDTLFLQGTYERKLQLQKGLSFVPFIDTNARPVQITIPGMNIEGDFYSLYVHPSGKYLLISMNNNQSLGEEDLFVSRYVKGEWTAPQHLGSVVNSSGYETSPFLSADASRLYFASNGHEGFGDADIFYTNRLDSSWAIWSTPVNLGHKINSEGFDGFPFQYKDKFYFSSNKGSGFSDIYVASDNNFYQPGDPLHIALLNNDARAKNFTATIKDSKGNVLEKLTPDETGLLVVRQLRETLDYSIDIENTGELNLENFEAFVLNEQGDKVMKLQKPGFGAFSVKGQTKGSVSSLNVLPHQKSTADEMVTGLFEFNQLPVQNVLVALVDETDTELFYTVTNAQGEFRFENLPPGVNFKIAPKTDLAYVAENGSIFITDPESGKKLVKASGNGTGNFTFRRLDEETLAKLSVLTNPDNTKLGVGVFKFRDLPKEGVRLVLMDENDNIIEEVITGPDGSFHFRKLNPDQPFLVKIASEDSELNADGQVLFIGKDGKTMPLLAKSEDGRSFSYKPLQSEFMHSLILEDESDMSATLAQEFFLSVGIFKYKELPLEGVRIQLLDENENVIEVVTTDAEGIFRFSKIRPEEIFFIRLAEGSETMYENSTMYFVSKDGSITPTELTKDQSAYMFSFNELPADYFFSFKELNEGETTLALNANFKDIYGVFKYQSLPKTGTKLYLVDENDNIIDSVFTDEFGQFKFRKLNRQDNFTIRLAEGDDTSLEGYSIALEDQEGAPIEGSPGDDSFVFNFKALPQNLEAALGSQDASDTKMDTDKYLTKKETRKREEAKLQKRPEPGEATIYFRFNSIHLSNTDRVTLNREIIKKAKRNPSEIRVVGYACDLGTQEVNESTSLMRANQVKAYLINMGINPEDIKIEAFGEVIDKSDAPSPETRRFNRKVEIYLAPGLTVL